MSFKRFRADKTNSALMESSNAIIAILSEDTASDEKHIKDIVQHIITMSDEKYIHLISNSDDVSWLSDIILENDLIDIERDDYDSDEDYEYGKLETAAEILDSMMIWEIDDEETYDLITFIEIFGLDESTNFFKKFDSAYGLYKNHRDTMFEVITEDEDRKEEWNKFIKKNTSFDDIEEAFENETLAEMYVPSIFKILKNTPSDAELIGGPEHMLDMYSCVFDVAHKTCKANDDFTFL